MPRYIDADDVCSKLAKFQEKFPDSWSDIEFALCIVEEQPTADVSPVVLCKDCIHYYDGACLKIYSDGNVSSDAWQERKPQDFCSYGETEEQMKKRRKGGMSRETW